MEERYRPAPVFDNGNSLLSDNGRYDENVSPETNIEKTVGQPFCASLERQAMELDFGLKLNYRKLIEQLEHEPDSRALDVLHIQLQKYESILKDDSLVVG